MLAKSEQEEISHVGMSISLLFLFYSFHVCIKSIKSIETRAMQQFQVANVSFYMFT
jgi:hypothetical protein